VGAHPDPWPEMPGGGANDAGQGSNCDKCTNNNRRRPKGAKAGAELTKAGGPGVMLGGG
jgi:hypothetical protein